MKNTQALNTADILAMKKSEAEEYIEAFDEKTKHLLLWYHGCTTNFLKEIQPLIEENKDDENYLEDLSHFLGLEVDRHNTIIPFWEDDDIDDEHSSDEDSDENDTPEYASPFAKVPYLEVDKANARADIYRTLLDQRIDVEAEMRASLHSLRHYVKSLLDDINTIKDGYKESGE